MALTFISGLVFVFFWIVYFSSDSSRTETIPLDQGLSVRETYSVRRTPYSGIADGGRAIYWPIPGRVDRLQTQQLLKNGRVLWEGNAAQSGVTRVFYPSPDGTVVLLEGQGYSAPWELVDTATGRSFQVPAPEIEGHNYVFPLVFQRWLPDSSAAIGKAEGTDFTSDRTVRFREAWRIDARTGAASRLQRTETDF